MTVQPTLARYALEQDGQALRLIIPSRKHWFQIFFLGIWVIVWMLITFGVGGTAVSMIFGYIQSADSFSLFLLIPGLFILFWLAFWVLGGLLALYTLLWQVIGREEIEIDTQSIRIRRNVAGLGPVKTYDAGSIRELRVSPYLLLASQLDGHRSSASLRNLGMLAFDYGAKTIRFGDMDEAEAKMALVDILNRYPRYGER